MNDSKNNPKSFPPDDFSATTPNIPVSKKDTPNFQNDGGNDWEKTNYNYSAKDIPDEKWKKTAYNVPAPQNPPSNNPPSKNFEWEKTQANINLPYDAPNQYEQPSDQGNDGSKQSDFGATTPFINLPESERAKFENPPPATTTITTEEEKKEGKKGVPGWMWATGGLIAMFLFAVAVLLGVYFLFLGKKGFDITLNSVPPRSDVFVNGSLWGVTSSDGTIVLQALKANEPKEIEIKNPVWTCKKEGPIIGEDGKNMDGKTLPVITVKCENTGAGKTGPTNPPGQIDIPDDCKSIKNGDFPKSRKCANDALDKIGDKDFTAQQLLDAMNLYIVNFAKSKADISSDDMPFLKRAAGFMIRLEKLAPDVNIQIGGHTDSDGTDAKNEPLSLNRAKAVQAVLVKDGVTASRLEVAGFGSKKPKPGNENRNEDEKFQNRRIEYKQVTK